ncbi:hypothetical protein ERJ75_000027000 [Trypanosoma vivax]|nr:hypothetical protein ERJ75_000027000 [Trypanosoma vivax]
MRAVDELWDLLEEKAVGGEAPALNEEEQVERKHAHERAEEGVLLRREYVDRVEQLVKEYQKAEEDMGATNSAVGASGQPLGSCSLVPLAEEFGCQRAATSHACYNVGGSNTPTAQLPAPLLKLFTAPSYAPILGYIGEVREQLQALVVQHHVRLAQTATEELTRVYQRYFSLTRDTSYRVAPNYSQWINELASAANGEKHGKNCGNANDILRERLCEVQHVMGRITEELNSLNSRLQILGELEPLLQRRAEILEQQRAIQDGSRERLLSRKVNMAKQLLYEENAPSVCTGATEVA